MGQFRGTGEVHSDEPHVCNLFSRFQIVLMEETLIVPIEPRKDLMAKSILVIAAHPDDEVLGCGGTIARHVAEGDAVYVLFMTDGVGARFGDSENPPDLEERQLAKTRALQFSE